MDAINTNESLALADLEPKSEVVGGSDTGALVNVGAANTYRGLTTVNQGTLSAGSQHPNGILVAMGDGSVR